MNCKKCGNELSGNPKYCGKCGEPVNNDFYVTQSNNSNVSNTTEDSTKSLKGLGGWLVVVCLGLIYTLWNTGSTVVSDAISFSDGTVESLSDIQGFARVLGFELIAYAVLFLFTTYLLLLFFKRKKFFPKLYIYFLISVVIVSYIDVSMLDSLSFPKDMKELIQGIIDEGYTEFGKNIFSAIIWTLYMKKSKRVKLTFIE